MSDMQQGQKKLDIEMSAEVAEGKFSNMAIVNHSPLEFVVDFLSMLPAMAKARCVSRIILTPNHAKRLAAALADNIGRYEKSYGEIKDVENNTAQMPVFGAKADA